MEQVYATDPNKIEGNASQKYTRKDKHCNVILNVRR
jgi:hypothetical protein